MTSACEWIDSHRYTSVAWGTLNSGVAARAVTSYDIKVGMRTELKPPAKGISFRTNRQAVSPVLSETREHCGRGLYVLDNIRTSLGKSPVHLGRLSQTRSAPPGSAAPPAAATSVAASARARRMTSVCGATSAQADLTVGTATWTPRDGERRLRGARH